MSEVDEVSRLVDRALKGISSSNNNNSKSFHIINSSLMQSGKVNATKIKTSGLSKEKTWKNDNSKLVNAINNSSLYNPLVSSASPLKESKPLGTLSSLSSILLLLSLSCSEKDIRQRLV